MNFSIRKFSENTSYSRLWIPGKEVPCNDVTGLLDGRFGTKCGIISESLSEDSESKPSTVSSANVSVVLGALLGDQNLTPRLAA